MNKLSGWLIGVVCVLLGVVFGLITDIRVIKKNNEQSNKYDISMMNQIDVDGFLDIFDKKGTYVIFIGREGCDVCESLAPALANAQKTHNFITQYLDITTVDSSNDNWSKLIEKLDLETTQKVSADSEEETNTFGYFINQYGPTPTVLVIKKGKLKAGFIGGVSEENLNTWLDNEIN